MRDDSKIRRAEKYWQKAKEEMKNDHPWWFDYVDYR